MADEWKGENEESPGFLPGKRHVDVFYHGGSITITMTISKRSSEYKKLSGSELKKAIKLIRKLFIARDDIYAQQNDYSFCKVILLLITSFHLRGGGD